MEKVRIDYLECRYIQRRRMSSLQRAKSMARSSREPSPGYVTTDDASSIASTSSSLQSSSPIAQSAQVV